MRVKSLFVTILVFASALSAFAQATPVPQPEESSFGMAGDIARIAASVQTMTRTLKEFVDKFAKVEGLSLSEKQQKLVMGMELLVRAEQRLATLQRFQIEVVEKEGQLRSRLTQVELDLNPQSIERNLAFEGSTQTPEIKETRRRALLAERNSLQTVLQQLQSNLQALGQDVREAQSLVARLRRTYLPQVEQALSEP